MQHGVRPDASAEATGITAAGTALHRYGEAIMLVGMPHAAIRIVLVETSHPGNIGAVARAMKNMGLSALHLVRPREFPHAEAYARASGADDLLNQAIVHADLPSALQGCGLVIGTSARSRHIPFVPLEPRACAELAVQRVTEGNQVAILFGTERTGLTNEQVALCGQLVTIPTSDTYSSLNIAMAVQIIAYELLLAARAPVSPAPEEAPLATAEDLERFYLHLQTALAKTLFRDHSGGHLQARVRRIFNRAQLDTNEIRILRGIVSALEPKP